jgi:hypothetical protein
VGRFVARFTGRGVAPDADLDRIRSTPRVTVLDTAPRMLLIEAPPETVRELGEALPGWIFSREQTKPLPDPRPKIRFS